MRCNRFLALASGALAFATAGSASAQCSVSGAAGVTILNCPGGTSILQTGPTGVATGMVGGQVFSGSDLGNGVIVGTLGGLPYNVVGGFVPAPHEAVPFNPPPPIVLGEPPPLSLAAPPPLSSPADAATREAARRRAAYLAELRRLDAERTRSEP